MSSSFLHKLTLKGIFLISYPGSLLFTRSLLSAHHHLPFHTVRKGCYKNGVYTKNNRHFLLKRIQGARESWHPRTWIEIYYHWHWDFIFCTLPTAFLCLKTSLSPQRCWVGAVTLFVKFLNLFNFLSLHRSTFWKSIICYLLSLQKQDTYHFQQGWKYHVTYHASDGWGREEDRHWHALIWTFH